MAFSGLGIIGIIIGTVLLCCFGAFMLFFSPKVYNKRVQGFRIINVSPTMTIKKLYDLLEGTSVGSGQARLMKVKTLGKRDCIVYLSENQTEFYYIYRSRITSRIIIAYSNVISLLETDILVSTDEVLRQISTYHVEVQYTEDTLNDILLMIENRLGERRLNNHNKGLLYLIMSMVD